MRYKKLLILKYYIFKIALIIFIAYCVYYYQVEKIEYNTENFNFNCVNKYCELSFSKNINSPVEYSVLAYKISKLDSSYHLHIYADGYGGVVVSGIYLIKNILASQVSLSGTVIQDAASMNANIALSIPNMEFLDDAEVLVHRPRSYIAGKAIFDPQLRCMFAENYFECVQLAQELDLYVRTLVKPYLTKEQLQQYDNKEDVILTGREINEMLGRN